MKHGYARNGPPVRLAIVGCGAVARAAHLPALARAGLDPVLFVDANLAKAQELAASYPGAAAASDVVDIGGRVDAAIVAVPHSLHCPITVALLSQQIHVLVEKPMALSRSECASMVDAAAQFDRFLAVGLNRRHYSALQWVHSLVRQGRLGDIHRFDIWEGYRFNWPVESLSYFSRAINGGGVLIDTGAHTLDLAEWLFGPLHVDTYLDDSDGGVEADCQLSVRGSAAVVGTIELSRTRDMRNVLSIESSKGGLIVDVYGSRVEGTGELKDLKGPARSRLRRTRETAADAFDRQLQGFLAGIEGRETSCVTGAEAARVIGLIEDCYSSRQPLVYPWESASGRARAAGDFE